MTKATINATALVLLPLALTACGGVDEQAACLSEASPGLLYGRIIDVEGETYEGRLRFGGDEEVLWSHYFNGVRDGNPWADQVPRAQLPRQREAIELFGVQLAGWNRRLDLERPFMARFGDIARIEARGRDLRVTLRSGTEVELDRYAADDFADGVRVWDCERGVVDFKEGRVRTIELFPAPGGTAGPAPLHGTVRTADGQFTGFIQWNREESLGIDGLDGETADGPVTLPFETIRSITRRSRESALVTLLDGREVVLSASHEVGPRNRGMYVDDARFGRVLVSWDAFETLEFTPGGSAPSYADFPAGGPLVGSVTTRDGDRVAGRLVFDLDESETTETLDAPARGVDHTLPFALVASIELPAEGRGARPVTVTLRDGAQLKLERAGDLGDANGGMLVFVEGREHPEYVAWSDVARVDLAPSGAR